MKSAPANRSALFDIGAAGPWAGVLFAIPAVMIGLALSEVKPLGPPSASGIILGDSLLFSALITLVLDVTPDEVRVILHPNALPVGSACLSPFSICCRSGNSTAAMWCTRSSARSPLDSARPFCWSFWRWGFRAGTAGSCGSPCWPSWVSTTHRPTIRCCPWTASEPSTAGVPSGCLS